MTVNKIDFRINCCSQQDGIIFHIRVIDTGEMEGKVLDVYRFKYSK